jgi:hypothetical protein
MTGTVQGLRRQTILGQLWACRLADIMANPLSLLIASASIADGDPFGRASFRYRMPYSGQTRAQCLSLALLMESLTHSRSHSAA